MKHKLISVFLLLALFFTGCGSDSSNKTIEESSFRSDSVVNESLDIKDTSSPEPSGEPADLGDDSVTFGESLEDTGAYDGYFEEESVNITIECLSGTQNAYKLDDTTLTFTTVSEDTVFSIKGTFRGNIIIDTGDNCKFELELQGFSMVCNSVNPITVLSGNEVTIKAKKDTRNYIYDTRTAIDDTVEGLYSGAIHSTVDLEIGGKGQLFVVSENNNGIHSKDDLQVKNLTLFIACVDNALKGNDSVEITDGFTTLIASGGDGIKTSKSDISQKGNQRGTISITGGTHTIYAACDGIDAAYDVSIDDETTELNIYTDKYSNYSREVTATDENQYYIRFTTQNYSYSIKYINSQTGKVKWVNAEYHSKANGGRSTYYYYAFPKLADYDKMQFFIYSADMEMQQEEEYAAVSDEMTPNTAYDTIALTSNSYSWTNYTTSVQEGGWGGGWGGGPGGFGGMGDGNQDKGSHSTKGIKAANEIIIRDGTVNIKSYDDAIHANNDTSLENGAFPLGNVTVLGGNLTLYSNDDGLHADGILTIGGGNVAVTNAYEGLEGTQVIMSGGNVSVNCKDDGINGTATSGSAIRLSGGTLYINCTGDGIDSNSRSSYSGIVFSGANVVVISNSGMNSAIDSEQGYEYTGGHIIALMPRGGMSNEATHCKNFSSVGTYTQLSLQTGDYLTVSMDDTTAIVKMPTSLSALIIVLGDSDAEIGTSDSVSVSLDKNGVGWS